MATSTSNLGLIKPAGTDHALVANINTNSDTIDTEAGKARANFALVQNGDTATAAISNGQLVVWKGVLKKATANIAIGATLSSSNLSDDTIAAELAALNSKMTKHPGDSISYNNNAIFAARTTGEQTIWFTVFFPFPLSSDVASVTASCSSCQVWTESGYDNYGSNTIRTYIFNQNSATFELYGGSVRTNKFCNIEISGLVISFS